MGAPVLRFYRHRAGPVPPVVPLPLRRAWAPVASYHCRPLTVASALGWAVLNLETFTATWDGGEAPDAVHIEPASARFAAGHFGSGIATVMLPFSVETSPGWGVWARGIPNYPVPGLHPLEGLIETAGFDGGFTMNYRLLDPGRTVMFPEGCPLFALTPVPLDFLAGIQLEVCEDGPAWEARLAALDRWNADRATLLATQPAGTRDGAYRQGVTHSGGRLPRVPVAKLGLAAVPGGAAVDEF